MKDPVKFINDATSFSLSNFQSALGFSVKPYLPTKNLVKMPENKADKTLEDEMKKGLRNLGSTYFQVPVTLRTSDEPEKEGFIFPLDPIISVNSKNIITRRYVSKPQNRGSIKERWSQDDWEVTISGVLTYLETEDDNYDVEGFIEDVRRYCDAKESVAIKCDLLNNTFGINYVTIESYDFPFTKGIGNQAFTLKCYSDDLYNLYIK